MRTPSRSLGIGIAFSLGVHGLVLWWLAGVTILPEASPATAEVRESTEVTVVLLPRPKLARPPEERPEPPGRQRADRTGGRSASARPAGEAVTGARTPSVPVVAAEVDTSGEASASRGPPGVPEGAQGSPGTPATGARIGVDAPLAGRGLFNPQVKVGNGTWGSDELGPPPSGDPRTLYEARTRFETATTSLGTSLQKGVEGKELPGDPGGRVALAQLAAALAPGKFKDPRHARQPDPIADPAVTVGGGAADLLRKREALLRLRAVADGPTDPLFRVRVEVIRRPGDPAPAVRLLQPSASAEFDLYVLGHAREWLRTRRALEGDAFFSELTRCVLEVAAYTSFRHDLASLRLEDLPGLAATTAVTGLGQGGTNDQPRKKGDELDYLGSRGLVGAAATFTFDDTTGKAEIVNLAKPRYRIDVAVLEAR